jgi:hypothetical protein
MTLGPAKPKKLLIITSSGGGGLIQTANAKEQEVRAQDPNCIIIRRDTLKDWTWKVFGKFCIKRWNQAQIKGDVFALKFYIWAQYFFDIICWPTFFYASLRTLLAEDVDRVIDTQNMGTSAIIKAIRIFNKMRGKQIKLEKVLVDLPTKKATHFFGPIKRLSRGDRPHLILTTILPLLEKGQSAADFWQRNCRLPESSIRYEDVYVRQSFLKLKNKPRDSYHLPLFLRFKNAEELVLMKKAYEKGGLKGQVQGDQILFSIDPKARVITILLGSQPASEATLNYVKKFLQLAMEHHSPKQETHLFVFSADHEVGTESLYKKVSDYVSQQSHYPAHFSIIPFSFQSDDVIAPLLHRSDLSCTRSGGQTAMEIMCVSSGETWIHSEAKKGSEQEEDLSLEELLKGIPGWEAENAVYLQRVKGARIVTPETFSPQARRFFRLGSAPALPSASLESKA